MSRLSLEPGRIGPELPARRTPALICIAGISRKRCCARSSLASDGTFLANPHDISKTGMPDYRTPAFAKQAILPVYTRRTVTVPAFGECQARKVARWPRQLPVPESVGPGRWHVYLRSNDQHAPVHSPHPTLISAFLPARIFQHGLAADWWAVSDRPRCRCSNPERSAFRWGRNSLPRKARDR